MLVFSVLVGRGCDSFQDRLLVFRGKMGIPGTHSDGLVTRCLLDFLDGGSSPGKHPRITKFFECASCEQGQLLKWSGQFPGCNWSTLTGKVNDDYVVVIDCDYKKNKLETAKNGVKNFSLLGAAIGESLPDGVPTCKTGGGGRHYYFRLPTGVTPPSGDNLFAATKWGSFPYIDVKCIGGKMMLPGCKHASGSEYEWENETTIKDPLPEQPPKLLNLIQEIFLAKEQSKSSKYKHESNAVYGEGERHTALVSYLGYRRQMVLTMEELTIEAHPYGQSVLTRGRVMRVHMQGPFSLTPKSLSGQWE